MLFKSSSSSPEKYFICGSFPLPSWGLQLSPELCAQTAHAALLGVAKASLPPSLIPWCLLLDFTLGICSPAGKTRRNTTAGGTPAPPRPRSSWPRSSAFLLVQWVFFGTEKLLMFHQTECEGRDCADAGRCPSKEGKSCNCGQRQRAGWDGAEPFLRLILRVPSTAPCLRLCWE